MTRIACFYVPMFPLAARLRSEPSLLEEAVAIVEGNGNHAHIVAATRRARTKGIRPGLSLAQARSILPKLIARSRDPECERTAQEALFDVAETFSPRIEDAGEGVVFADVTGMERHYQPAAGSGPPAGDQGRAPSSCVATTSQAELALARAAIDAAAKIGLPVRLGIAASKLAARVAAELPKSPTIVEAGGESEFLAPLPLTRLSPQLDVAATLARWGIGSIGELARLPESEVATRLGELGRELHYAARGIDPRPLIPRALPPEFREGTDLEWPLVALEPFLFIANAALDRLSQRMEMQGFACKRLELTLTLEPDGFYSRAIDLPAPTRDVKTMLTLLRLDLEKSPPGAPVVGFMIVAHPDRPRRAQLSLFGPAALSPEKLATTIARLVSLLGDGRVGMALSVDGHLPERYAVGDYAPPPPPDARRKPEKSRGLLALRVFRPALPVEVLTREHDGELLITTVHGEGDLSGNVRVASGPWRVEAGWWSDVPASREYWDVELDRGGVYRLYQSGEEWFVDARYD
ncbi:MAG: DNA polymerase Y family protein [Acidobacteriota bacterium]